jgi:hypothetical protein
VAGPLAVGCRGSGLLFKQAVDVRGGEKPEEASGDVAEFAAGLLAGWLVARLSEAFQLSTCLQLKTLAVLVIATCIAIIALCKQRVKF